MWTRVPNQTESNDSKPKLNFSLAFSHSCDLDRVILPPWLSVSAMTK